ncbi:hypothetical protein PAMP_019580 [Pampus punctatissimus]
MAKHWSATFLVTLALLSCLVGTEVEAQESTWQKPAPHQMSKGSPPLQVPSPPKNPQYPYVPQIQPPPPQYPHVPQVRPPTPPKDPQYPHVPQVRPPTPPKDPQYPHIPQVRPPTPPKDPQYPHIPQVRPPTPPKDPQYPHIPQVRPPTPPKDPQYPHIPQVRPPTPPKDPQYPHVPQIQPPQPQYPHVPQVRPPTPPKDPQYPHVPQIQPPRPQYPHVPQVQPPTPPKDPQYPHVPQVRPPTPPKDPQYPHVPQVRPPTPPKDPQYPHVPQVRPPTPPKDPQYPHVPQVRPPTPPKDPQYPHVPQVRPPTPPKDPQYPHVPQVRPPPPPKTPQYPQRLSVQPPPPPKTPQYPQGLSVQPPPPPKTPQYPQGLSVQPPPPPKNPQYPQRLSVQPPPPRFPQYPQGPKFPGYPRAFQSSQDPEDPQKHHPWQPEQPQQPQQPHKTSDPNLHTCEVDHSQRIPCGCPDISATACEAINCCFDGRQCYFGKSVTVQCTKDAQFIVVVARDATLPNIDLGSISLLGEGHDCTHVDSNSHFAIYQFPVTACGSIVMCRYIGTSVETVIVEVLPLLDPPLPVAALGPISVQLRLANGQCHTKGCYELDVAYSSFYTEADYPVTKVLRDPVYVEVQLMEKTDPMLVLTLGRCWTTTSPNPHSLPQWDILIDGCPYRDDRYLSSLVPVGSSSGLNFPSHYRRFLFKMFTFVEPSSLTPMKEQVYIHCSTAVCSAAPGRSCEPSCFRKRRDVVAEQKREEPKVVVSVGPVIMAAPETE